MKPDRMKGKRFLNRYTYVATRTQIPDREKYYPENYPKDSTKSLTTPNQTITIKQLMERHEKGQPTI